MSDLRAVLKTLCITYGPSAIQGTLDELVNELQRDIELYRQAGPKKVVPVVVAATSPTTTATTASPAKLEKESKIVKQVKTTKEILKDLVVVKKEDAKPANTLAPTKQETADKFLRHKLLIDQRASQLKAEGREAPFPLLTQDNMKQWIEKEGLTYWKIAEMVGAPDKLVSAMAKLYNLQSNASKMIQFKKQQK